MRAAIWRVALALALIAGIALAPLDVHDSVAQPAFRDSRAVWVEATGQLVTGPMLAYWLAHREIGQPVSGMTVEGGLLTQWFEYARLELDPVPPESATIANVHRHQIGRSVTQLAGYNKRVDAFRPREQGEGRYFPETGHAVRFGFLSEYEQHGNAERLGLPISEEFAVGSQVFQFFEYGALSWTGLAVERLALGRLDAGLRGKIGAPQPRPAGAYVWGSNDMIELSDLLPGERWIEIDLNARRLTARVGDLAVLESTVSIGSPYSPTVAGNFTVYLKYRVQSLSGIGWNGLPFYAPDTPWVMYFWQDYAIHPSWDRSSYGYADTQGCVVPPMEVAEALWHWAGYGTRVWVHY